MSETTQITRNQYHKITDTDGDTHEHYLDAQGHIVSIGPSRKLTDDEIKAFRRSEFINKVLDHVITKQSYEGQTPDGVHHMSQTGGGTARFLVHRNNYSIVEVKEGHRGEYNFSIADKSYYSYHLWQVVQFLEDIFDAEGVQIISLKGERFQI